MFSLRAAELVLRALAECSSESPRFRAASPTNPSSVGAPTAYAPT